MIQITNQRQNYRKNKIMNWQLKQSYTSHPNKLSKSYFKTFRQNQNNLIPSLSTPKNIKILPRIQRQHKVQLGYRYIQTPISQLYNNRLKFNQTSSQQSHQPGYNLFFRSQKKRTVQQNKSDKIQSQLNHTSPIQDRQSYHNINININNNSSNINNINNNLISSKYYVLNRKGKRPYNQDRFICKNNLHKYYIKNYKNQTSKKQQKIQLYSVFDGHGGTACAQYLKENFVNFLLRSKTFQTNHEEALKQACKIAQEKFIALCQAKKFGLQTSGACAISCLVTDNKITVASIGDCRAIMFNKQYLCEMTKDHKPSEISQKMRIIKCGGKIYKQQLRMNRPFNSTVKNFSCVRITPGNLNVSRTIGDIQAKMKKYGGLPGMISPQPEIKTFQKQNYQILLLASDGLFEAFTNKQIQQFYYKIVEYQKRKVIPASQIGQKFIESLMQQAEQKSTDNITIIVVMLHSSANMTDKSLTLQNFTQKNINI